jgi:[protein-PII] uridylyltransferase
MVQLDEALIDVRSAFATSADDDRHDATPTRTAAAQRAALPIRHALRILAAERRAADAPLAAVAAIRPALVDAQHGLIARYLDDGTVDALMLGRARLVDGLVVGLLELARQSRAQSAETIVPPLAAVAIGEHGGRWLAPGSPLDLLFLMPAPDDAGARSLAEFVVQALDRLGCAANAVIDTSQHCLEEASAHPQLVERLLEARLIWGSIPLWMRLMEGLPRRFGDPGGPTVRGVLARQVAASLAREGRTAYFEPDLKHGTGALADLRRLALLAALEGRRPRADDACVHAACDAWRFLARVRGHLHIVDSSVADRLVADAQAPIAARLGLADGYGAGAKRLRDACEAHRNQVRAVMAEAATRNPAI